MDDQERVARFIDDHGLQTPVPYRVLDLLSELGEVAKEINTSTDYGHSPDELGIAEDEIGDVLFALLALCVDLDVDCGEALELALEKYESRIDGEGDPGSGR